MIRSKPCTHDSNGPSISGARPLRRIYSLVNAAHRLVLDVSHGPTTRHGLLVVLFPILVTAVSPITTGCGTGEGVGQIHSDALHMENCWDGPFDLNPNFFGGVSDRSSYQIRVQRGSELEDVSDGVSVLVDDVHEIRGDGNQPSQLGLPLRVGLPPSVTPPGIPRTTDPNPPVVHLTLYLHRTCHAQVAALYAVDGYIVFKHLFNGDANEPNADKRLTEATFDVVVADPRDQPTDGSPIPESAISHLQGWFRFYFERGQPAQPFP